MSRKNTAPVVIIRKDKRIRHKLLHAIAFAATGGASIAVTGAEALNHAGYNARTRRLQAQAGTADAQRGISPDGPSARLADAAEQAARQAIEHGIPRDQLGAAAQLAYDRLTGDNDG
jgi:hypothetical protein